MRTEISMGLNDIKCPVCGKQDLTKFERYPEAYSWEKSWEFICMDCGVTGTISAQKQGFKIYYKKPSMNLLELKEQV